MTKMTYMPREIPRVSRERMVITACGMKEAEVSTAAAKPSHSGFMVRIVGDQG